MSILIKGAKKPDHCLLCFAFRNDMCAVAKKEVVLSKGVQEWCPFVEIPPHGRLIDADYTKKHLTFSRGINDCGVLYAPYGEIKKEIDRMPTVIESEEQENE